MGRKKREGKHDEVMLIPFLDILCSLIGILVLIVVVVCVAQMQKLHGRTPQEIALSQKYVGLLRQQREMEKAALSIVPGVQLLCITIPRRFEEDFAVITSSGSLLNEKGQARTRC